MYTSKDGQPKVSLDRLYRHMELEEVTAAKLAERVGLSRQAVYNILNGKSQPKPETLERICKALNCNPDALTGPDLRDTDHHRFADVLVARRNRELMDYDVEAATLEYVRNWLVEHYNDLTREQFKEAKEEADTIGGDFAKDVARMLLTADSIGVSVETQTKATEEAFDSFFDVLETMVGCVICGVNEDFDLFEGMPKD